jgi:hypothetical protein
VTVVGVEHALMHKTCFVHPQNVIWKSWCIHSPQKTTVWKQMCGPWVVVWVQMIVMWDNPNFRVTSCELLHGCCSTAVVMASSLLASVQSVMTCIQVCHRCYNSYLTETLLQLLKYTARWCQPG